MSKIAYAQIEVVAGQPELNTEKILDFVAQAKKQKAELVIFPEMAVSGKFIGRALKEKSFLQDCESFGQKIVAASEGIIIVFGNIDSSGRSRYFIAHEGKIATQGDAEKFISIGCKISSIIF